MNPDFRDLLAMFNAYAVEHMEGYRISPTWNASKNSLQIADK